MLIKLLKIETKKEPYDQLKRQQAGHSQKSVLWHFT